MGLTKTNALHQQVDTIYTALLNSVPLYLKKIDPIAKEYQLPETVLIKELIKYFIVTEKSNQMTSPPYVVDLIWHELILFTRFYQQFCIQNFGKFIHHTPSENSEPKTYSNTLAQYKTLFGNPVKEIWYTNNSFNLENTNCGSCHQ